MSINYTVIIPHKDIPALLDRCVESVPAREDIQVIVVDDASDHGPSGYVQERALVLVQPENLGAGAARNAALPLAEGRWLLFADADDRFLPGAFDILDAYLESSSDMVFFGADCVVEGEARPWKRTARLDKWMADKDEKSLRYRFGEPWCKLIRRSFIQENAICFEQTSIHNDTMFSLLCGHYAKTVEIESRQLYCVTDRPGSVSLGVQETKILERVGVFGRADLFLRVHTGMKDERAFIQIWTDIQHKRFNLARRDIEVLQSLGFNTAYIYWRMFITFFIMLGRRISK